MTGKLVIAATPVGNDRDASERLKDHLAHSSVIAAEDTRRAKSLLTRLNIRSQAILISYYDHNENERIDPLLDRLEKGENILLISDAGMPLVSDPGYRLVTECIHRGIKITVLPGPSAVLAALAISGLPADRFIFEGFAPRKSSARKTWLTEFVQSHRTVVFFESPHRLSDTLHDVAEILGPDRDIVVCRELTKTYEEVIRGKGRDLVDWVSQSTVKGEITVVIGPGQSQVATLEELVMSVHHYVSHGEKLRTAAKIVAAENNRKPKELYDEYINRKLHS